MLHVPRCLPDYHLLLGPVHSPRIPGTVRPPRIPGTVRPPRTAYPLLRCPVHSNQCRQWTQSEVPVSDPDTDLFNERALVAWMIQVMVESNLQLPVSNNDGQFVVDLPKRCIVVSHNLKRGTQPPPGS